MATIDKLYKSMGLPMNIKRGNPWPLDVSSLWYSYDEMKAYAEDTAGVSYVGQILALVDEEKNTATAYIIADANGTLKQVGAGPVIDEHTMMVDEDSKELSLKDFGKRFYKYIPEVKDAEGNVVTEAAYDLVEVSVTYPWAAGLEPRVVSENGELVLGWFEPNPTTIEGVNNQVSSIQSSVADLQQVVSDLAAEVGEPAAGGKAATGLHAEIDKKANAEDVFTKDEVRTEIAVSIADADHLRRKKLGSYSELVAFKDANADADKYIFMIPTDDSSTGDLYDEYMIIDGAIEKVGEWTVDLSDYVTKDALDTELEGYISNSALDTKLADYVSEGELETELQNYASLSELALSLSGKVDKEEGKRLITEEEAQKLKNLSVSGEENFVKSVTSDFTVSDTGELSLNKNTLDLSTNTIITELNNKIKAVENDSSSNAASLAALEGSINANTSSIETLQNTVSGLDTAIKANASEIETLQTGQSNLTTQLENLTKKVGDNESSISNLITDLNNYVLKSTYNADIAEIRDILTWKDMDETSAV